MALFLPAERAHGCIPQCSHAVSMTARPLSLRSRWSAPLMAAGRTCLGPVGTLKSVHPPRRQTSVSCSAQQAAVGKEIARTEIPAFVPRGDLIQQIMRWAFQESQADGMANFGLPLKVTPQYRGEDELWGFTAAVVRDGKSATEISVRFDEETVTKFEWVGRGNDGFPVMEGDRDEILGKHLVIRKADDNPIDEEVRSVIREFCQQLVATINKYYAFGSAFVDDET